MAKMKTNQLAELFANACKGAAERIPLPGTHHFPAGNIFRNILGQIGWTPDATREAKLFYRYLSENYENLRRLSAALDSGVTKGYFFWNWTAAGWCNLNGNPPGFPTFWSDVPAIVTLDGPDVYWLEVRSEAITTIRAIRT